MPEECGVCPYCGAQVHTVQITPEGEEQKKRSRFRFSALGVGAALLIVLCVGIVLLEGGTGFSRLLSGMLSPKALFAYAHAQTLQRQLVQYETLCREQAEQGIAYSYFLQTQSENLPQDLFVKGTLTCKEKLQQLNLELGAEESTLLQISGIWDQEQAGAYLTLPQLHSQSLYIPTGKPHSQASRGEWKNVLIPYAEEILNGFSDFQKENQQVQIGPCSRELTVIKAHMSQKDMCTLGLTLTDRFCRDTQAQQLLGISSQEGDLLQEKQIQDFRNRLQRELEESSPENYVYLHTYLNNDCTVLGYRLTFSSQTQPVWILCLPGEAWIVQIGQFRVQGFYDTSKWEAAVYDGNQALGTVAVQSAKNSLSITARPEEALLARLPEGQHFSVLQIDICRVTAGEIALPKDCVEITDSQQLQTWNDTLDAAPLIQTWQRFLANSWPYPEFFDE